MRTGGGRGPGPDRLRKGQFQGKDTTDEVLHDFNATIAEPVRAFLGECFPEYRREECYPGCLVIEHDRKDQVGKTILLALICWVLSPLPLSLQAEKVKNCEIWDTRHSGTQLSKFIEGLY